MANKIPGNLKLLKGVPFKRLCGKFTNPLSGLLISHNPDKAAETATNDIRMNKNNFIKRFLIFPFINPRLNARPGAEFPEGSFCPVPLPVYNPEKFQAPAFPLGPFRA